MDSYGSAMQASDQRMFVYVAIFKSKLPLGKLVWINISWVSDTPVHHVTWHLDISKQTLVDWSNFICDVCAEDLFLHFRY